MNTGSHIGFFSVLKLLLTNYLAFLEFYIAKSKRPAFGWVIFIVGISQSFYFLMLFVESNSKGWPILILAALGLSLPVGFLLYGINGVLIHLFVRLADGLNNLRRTCDIYIYSTIPLHLTYIGLYLLDSLVMENTLYSDSPDPNFFLMWLILTRLSSLFSIVLLYRGVRLVQNAEDIKATIIFLILPLVFLFWF